jgi:RNA polymerase sigma factor (sigma-70 family)
MPREDDLFREVYAVYGQKLERYAFKREWEPQERKDLMQDIYYSIWSALHRLPQGCSLEAWIFRIAGRVIADHCKKRLKLRSLFPVTLEEIDRRFEPCSDPRSTMLRKQTLEQLIDRLSLMDQQIVNRYRVEEDVHLIAVIVGISPIYVATKISRIKKILSKASLEGGPHGQ